MTNYTPTDSFSTVQRYDTGDPVLGGASGQSSLPVEQLANRTEFLNNRLGGYYDVVDITGSASITAATHANRLLAVAAGANVTLTVAALSTFKKGARIAVTAAMTASGGPYWVNIVPAESIIDGFTSRANMWLYDGEMIELVAGTSGWHLTIAKGNFDKIGQDDLKRIQPRNTFLAIGTPNMSRAKYPRLWAVVSAGAVTEAAWAGDSFRYRSMFSTGNATTTFRAPDMRAMVWRGLDLGRGVDTARLDEVAGGYEADAVKAHIHDLPAATGAINTGAGAPQYPPGKDATVPSASTGGSENLVKNIGLNPVIYY